MLFRSAGLGRLQLKVHEQNAPPMLQFLCLKNIQTTGWTWFCGREVEEGSEAKQTSCQYEFTASWKDFAPCDADLEYPDPMVLSFDIECYSHNPNKMPEAKHPADKVFQISCVLFNKKDGYRKYLLSLGRPGDIDETEILTYEKDRKSTRLNSSHSQQSRMPSSA